MEILADLSPTSVEECSAIWAGSGAATLSGRADGPPLDVPRSMVGLAVAATARIEAITGRLGRVVELDGPALLGERAALMGLSRRGDVSCGGAARLLRAADGWIAVSLARESDVASVPAWLDVGDPDELVGGVCSRTVVDLIERGAMLGMPVAGIGERVAAARATSLADATQLGACPPPTSISDLVVLDLSALWAGPLCASVLGLAGARVIKVESDRRPDGARLGSVPFFDLLHGGYESVAFDFTSTDGVHLLRRLIERADIVIESSRPRALRQLGIDGERLNGRPRVWLSITGHGRGEADAMRVGFGDDAAVAGGLVATDEQGPCFCVDAVADPLSGMVAAAAVLTALERGDRWLIDVALSRTAAVAARGPLTDLNGLSLAEPRARAITATAAPLGQHTDEVVAELARSS